MHASVEVIYIYIFMLFTFTFSCYSHLHIHVTHICIFILFICTYSCYSQLHIHVIYICIFMVFTFTYSFYSHSHIHELLLQAYNLTIIVDDQLFNASTLVEISIIDVNDNPPVFSQTSYVIDDVREEEQYSTSNPHYLLTVRIHENML